MDEDTKLFENIKESQIYTIKNQFENKLKSSVEALRELENLASDVDALKEKNKDQSFQDAAELILDKINNLVNRIILKS
jgi:hypothetical protein